ncbi:MAG: ribosome biogenesis GTP-binding protein YihA/YsxC [Methylophilaceae bacterium]|jgi:GTP-binding protein|nr:ribosome biogenesis GTP-binding protein YihA/YsxC [Methylophilaceae bacterium]MDG1445385.1 ribosome biogenesis GTP-binding protein YihA/YsxC [Methylophilaceae bacterium]MDG1820770.1 ribosome biogenesis GTP-binding protein YihA/YsxC [Methylophilaceae bacterium]MDG2293296.1 ribosome biogenesis GTP-binding protein YihA/YsxC [Methylophilaceae bacterium]
MSLFQNAAFSISANNMSDLPPPNGVEIAFAGRSNAGKSSALNTLANHNRLAYVSKQPGRTQLINFFCLNPERGNDQFLVDLPGYGYAKVPESIRKHWQSVLSSYLTERSSLVGLVLVMDSRRPLTPLDIQMLDWFCHSGKPVHVLLTKSDKLSRNEGKQTLFRTRAALIKGWGENVTVQLFSSLKKEGVAETEKMIGGWLFPVQSNEIGSDSPKQDD